MQHEAANLTSGRSGRLILYATSMALALALFVPMHHRLWPMSFLSVAAGPVVDGVRGRATPRRKPREADAWGDLAGELAALEGTGLIVVPEVAAGRERIPLVVIGPTGVFTLRQVSWPGQFSLKRDGWFQHSKGDAGEVVWHATREVMALREVLSKAGVPVAVHGVVVATRSVVRGRNGSIDLGRVAFVEGHRLAQFVRSRRHTVSPEHIAAVTRVLSD